LTDDDATPTDLPIANPAHGPLVRALFTHALVLENTARLLTAIREDLRARVDIAPASQMAELGKVFRDEADSALDLARAAERLALGGAR
jgi:hypothetical protein